ncbi:MAG: NAD(P)-binding domain-containing protein [Oscillochloris sp.]|nr:NAD(P)-binding domain-containing protein [Oscillochloris sp.]
MPDQNSPKAQAAAAAGLHLSDTATAATFGEVVIIALPLKVALTELPELPLAGKIVIDANNPLDRRHRYRAAL